MKIYIMMLVLGLILAGYVFGGYRLIPAPYATGTGLGVGVITIGWGIWVARYVLLPNVLRPFLIFLGTLGTARNSETKGGKDEIDS